MKRGGKFFNDFTSDGAAAGGGKKKGRSGQLLAVRNEKLLHRYYYHSLILQYKYEQVLASLMGEFDLSESTLVQIIEKNTALIKLIRDKQLTRAQLKKKYPS